MALCLATLAWPLQVLGNPEPKSERFVRGSGDDPRFHSFVIPLDFQKGVALDAGWADLSNFLDDETYPWFLGTPDSINPSGQGLYLTRYHIQSDGGTGHSYDSNSIFHPIAAFGSASGGTPLYTDRAYRFGFYAGGQTGASHVADELRIRVFAKSDYDAAQNVEVFQTSEGPRTLVNLPIHHDNDIQLPRFNTPEWDAFAADGFVLTHTATASDGTPLLETKIEFVNVGSLLASAQWGTIVPSPLILTHRALPAAKDYFFRVDYRGQTADESSNFAWTVVNDLADPLSSGMHSLGYALGFERMPVGRVSLIDDPHFSGDPLPPHYHGKSVEELTSGNQRFEIDYGLPDSSHDDLTSTELIVHPELERFVDEMGSDPIALANYVINEILLTDALAYNEDGNHDTLQINDGGITRGALATFMEGQGSPSEQSALLVYLLRSAGYKAAYVVPPADSMHMLAPNLGRLLEMQIQGMVDAEGNETISSDPVAIPVNYPWVAFYDDAAQEWHNIFPWLKNTEIIEGLNLYDYLPVGYDSPWNWADKYLTKDPRALDQIYQQPDLTTDANGVVSIEAEGFFDNLSPDSDAWEAVEVDGASGSGAMQVLSDDGTIVSSASIATAAELNYHVNFAQAGTYQIWVRGKGADASGDSVHIGLDDSVVAAELGSLPTADLGWVNTLSGGGVAQLTISSPGIHTINLWMHEDGAIVDKIVLTKEVSASFSDTGPDVVPFESGASTENPLPDDMAATVMRALINTELKKNYPEISIEDLGVDIRRRKQFYSRWQDFPQPWSVDAAAFGATPGDYLVGGFDEIPNKFNTLEFKLYKDDSTTPFFSSPSNIPVLHFHNRRLLFRWEPVGSVHRLFVILGPYDRTASVPAGNFSSSNYLGEQRWDTGIISTDFTSTEDSVRVETSLKRHLSFTGAGHSAPSAPWASPFNLNISTEQENELVLQKGAVGSLCFNFGRVTERMLRIHLEEIWEYERDVAENGEDSSVEQLEAFQGAATFLMGMTYFFHVDESLEFIQDLHKYNVSSLYGVGFAKMEPWRNPDGSLPSDGSIYPDQPAVDMYYTLLSLAASSSLHPDAGLPREKTLRDYVALFGAALSAHEHGIINRFWDQSEAISTVKLLHRAGQANIVSLTSSNYLTGGNVTYDGVALKDIDSQSWASVVNVLGDTTNSRRAAFAKVYITPGAITGAEGDYKGVGTMIYESGGIQALVSGNMATNNGGAGQGLIPKTHTESILSTSPTDFSPGIYDRVSFSGGAGGSSVSTSNTLTTIFSGNLFSGSVSHSQASNTFSSLSSGSFQTTSFWNHRNSNFLNSVITTSSIPTNSGTQFQQTTNIGTGSARHISSSVENIVFASTTQRAGLSTSSYQGATFAGDPVDVVTGEFYIDETDLVLPGPFPLSIRRNYGSLNIGQGEFGHGWKMAYFPYLVLSDDSSVIYASEMDGSVIAYERDGSTNTWRPTLEANPQFSNPGSGIANRLNATIEIPTGQTGALGDEYILTSADGSQRIFRVREFPIGTNLERRRPYLEKWEDNAGNYHTFEFYDDDFYQSSVDPSKRGSEYGQLRRIEASNGNFLGLRYNTVGNVTEIFSRDGRRVFYGYDDFGDLVAVERPDASVIQYDYLHKSQAITDQGEATYSEHLITRVTHPEGRILENTYDEERRVISQKATIGDGDANDPDAPVTPSNTPAQQAIYDYSNLTRDLATGKYDGYVEVFDPYHRKTTFVVVGSRVTSVTDQAGITHTTEWYADGDTSTGAYPRAIKRQVDRRGLITEFKYDSQGNVIETKITGDLDGDPGSTETAISTATYTALNMPSVTTDSVGNQTLFFYEDLDYPYHPTRIEERASGGALISHHVNVYTETGGGPNAPPFARGLVQSTVAGDDDNNPNNNGGAHTDPNQDHALVEFEYNDAGFLTRQTTHSGTSDPNVISEFDYNLRGELVEKRDLDGGTTKRTTLYGYDDMGRRIWDEVLDESGAQVSWNYAYYNQNGELEWSDGPRYNPEDYVYRRYDGMGRLIEQVAWRSQAKADGSGVEAVPGYEKYATTFTAYNLFGNAVKVTDPRGNTARYFYDATGRKTEARFYEGDWEDGGTLLSSESWQYEDGDKVSQHTNPLGGITRFFYTDTGQPRRQENPDGTVLEWRYANDGRVIREPISHNTYWEIAYNDANRQVTKTLRSVSGGTLGVPVVTTVDRRGNVTSTNDLAGHVTTTQYDDLNRVIATTGPATAIGYLAQQSGTVSYDAAEFVTVATNALGEQTVSNHDALGRTVLTQIKAAGGSVVRQATIQYSADFHAVTTLSGTGADQIVSTTYTDNAAENVLTVHADGTFVHRAVDANGNVVSVTDEVGLTTSSAYDGLNRATSSTLPDGAQTVFVYDAAGNLKERRMPGGSVEIRSYDSASRVTGSRLEDSSQNTTRVSSYVYHGSGPHTGLLDEHTDGRSVVHDFVYDDFRRVETTTATHPSNSTLNVSRTSVFDARSLATSITETTLGGSRTTVIGQNFDEYGQLYEQTVSVDGNTVRHLTNTYDAAGRRINLDKGGSVASLGSGAGSAATFGYRADGLLASVTRNSQTYSYSYADNGLLQSRVNPWRTQTVTVRDNRGRIQVANTDIPDLGGTALIEGIGWYADSRHAQYRSTTSRISGSSWHEDRFYSYNNRRQLTSETFSPSPGVSQTISYQFDGNQSAGPGVRTAAIGSNGSDLSVTVPVNGVDGFQRVVSEDSNNESTRVSIDGSARGAAAISLALHADISISPERITYVGPGDPSGDWSTYLDLSPGDYTVQGTAIHASGASASQINRSFSVNRSAAKSIDLNHFDDEGNATRRNVAGGKDQVLTWDALGRLIAVTQRDGNGHGIDWTATYDAFNRRLETTTTPVENNIADTAATFTEGQWYDPLVEFLIIAVETQRAGGSLQRTWKAMGPDAVGGYGGFQGIGGVEATIVEETGETVALMDDVYGHIVGYIRTSGSVATDFHYANNRYSGYGALPGSDAPSLYQGAQLSRALGWRGSAVDATGFYCLGERYYEPNSGRFLSADPWGHAESLSLYCYAGGDPINFVDPTGRGKQDYSGVVQISSAPIWDDRNPNFDPSAFQSSQPAALPQSTGFLPSLSLGKRLRNGLIEGLTAGGTGALVGAGAGSVIPGAGTAAGAISGGVGGFIGGFIGGAIKSPNTSTRDLLVSGAIGGVVDGLSGGVGSRFLSTARAGSSLAARQEVEIVQRAMSRVELESIQDLGVLSRGGRPGPHFVSDAVNSTSTRARQRLALPGTPEVRVTLEVPRGAFSPPTTVRPYRIPGTNQVLPGGGLERTAPGNLDIPVRIIDVLDYMR
ncbi:MAG: DUF6531 domain-containing protein [Verrucomicrobiota bacterium]